MRSLAGRCWGARFQANTMGSRLTRRLPLEVMVELTSSMEQRGGRSMYEILMSCLRKWELLEHLIWMKNGVGEKIRWQVAEI